MILLVKGEKTVSLESEAISSCRIIWSSLISDVSDLDAPNRSLLMAVFAVSTNHSSSGSAFIRKKLEKSIARKNSSIQWKWTVRTFVGPMPLDEKVLVARSIIADEIYCRWETRERRERDGGDERQRESLGAVIFGFDLELGLERDERQR